MAGTALVGVIMGSRSDWETLRHTAETLEKLGIAHETRVVSAHRTPERLLACTRTSLLPTAQEAESSSSHSSLEALNELYLLRKHRLLA
jgi:phosphoribosylcarboxyaminoimidazole (NCAIR) mutase